MMDWIESLPLGWAILLFWCGAMVRSTTTFALGRGIAVGVEHTSLRRYMAGPIYLRAMKFIDRWGPWAIPFCFLTVGIQTAVIGTAGITRMKWHRFIPAAMLGSMLWGVIYGTIGMAVVWAVITAALASPWVLGALVLALAGVVVLVLWHTGGFARFPGRESRAQLTSGHAGEPHSSRGRDAGGQEETTSDAGR